MRIDLKIGEVAKLAGVGVETVRYYEKRGLIEEPPRSYSGYRMYPESTPRKIRFIKRAQELGFTLKEIAQLLTMMNDDRSGCQNIQDLALEKITDIEGKIQHLQRLKKTLTELVEACPGQGPLDECLIMEALLEKETNGES